jgi:hypothetical protein
MTTGPDDPNRRDPAALIMVVAGGLHCITARWLPSALGGSAAHLLAALAQGDVQFGVASNTTQTCLLFQKPSGFIDDGRPLVIAASEHQVPSCFAPTLDQTSFGLTRR